MKSRVKATLSQTIRQLRLDNDRLAIVNYLCEISRKSPLKTHLIERIDTEYGLYCHLNPQNYIESLYSNELKLLIKQSSRCYYKYIALCRIASEWNGYNNISPALLTEWNNAKLRGDAPYPPRPVGSIENKRFKVIVICLVKDLKKAGFNLGKSQISSTEENCFSIVRDVINKIGHEIFPNHPDGKANYSITYETIRNIWYKSDHRWR